jgi:hypothetical protein
VFSFVYSLCSWIAPCALLINYFTYKKKIITS